LKGWLLRIVQVTLTIALLWWIFSRPEFRSAADEAFQHADWRWLGFGLALAPVNAALLASTRPAVHGVASALLVVCRMVGMLVGISALTTIGLRRYYAVSADFPSPGAVCGGGHTRCDAYTDLLQGAGVAQLHAIFVGAAGCAFVAGVLSLVLFRGARTSGAGPLSALTAGA